MDITRLDPRALDLAVAGELAAVQEASLVGAGLELPAPAAGSLLAQLQHGSSGRPVSGLLVASEGDAVRGWATLELPQLENTWAAHLRGWVHPAHRGRGTGSALHDAVVELARVNGRSTLYAGAFDRTGGDEALARWGYRREGQSSYAIRRTQLRATGTEPATESRTTDWQQLADAHRTPDYEIVRLVGATPEMHLHDLAMLHAAINDAPPDDPDHEAMAWDVERVVAYDRAMAARRQTVHRVLARHRASGDWAGMSVLCVDEFRPRIAFQEDTSVVPAHRGHRLGLRLKAELHRWVGERRPEVVATDTWNALDNHHMIAVNERLGARVVAHHHGARKDL